MNGVKNTDTGTKRKNVMSQSLKEQLRLLKNLADEGWSRMKTTTEKGLNCSTNTSRFPEFQAEPYFAPIIKNLTLLFKIRYDMNLLKNDRLIF